MADQKHKGPTPGPWKLQGNADRLVVASDPRYGIVATVHRNVGPGDEPEQCKANAEVISQAWAIPMLVKALAALWQEHVRTVEKAVGLLREYGFECDGAEEMLAAHEHITGAQAALALLQEREGK